MAGKSNLRGSPQLVNDLVVRGGGADRGVGMRHVGDGEQDGMQVFRSLLDLLLETADLFAQRLALGNQLLLLGRVFLLGDELGQFVLPLLDLLLLLEQSLAVVVQRDDTVHVGLDIAVTAVGFDGLEIGADKSSIQHGDIPGIRSEESHTSPKRERGVPTKTP